MTAAAGAGVFDKRLKFDETSWALRAEGPLRLLFSTFIFPGLQTAAAEAAPLSVQKLPKEFCNCLPRRRLWLAHDVMLVIPG